LIRKGLQGILAVCLVITVILDYCRIYFGQGRRGFSKVFPFGTFFEILTILSYLLCNVVGCGINWENGFVFFTQNGYVIENPNPLKIDAKKEGKISAVWMCQQSQVMSILANILLNSNL